MIGLDHGYETATGAVPHWAGHPVDLREQMLNGDVTRPSGVGDMPETVTALNHRTLERRPESSRERDSILRLSCPVSVTGYKPPD